MTAFTETTPEAITNEIKHFAKRLSTAEPLLIPVVPAEGAEPGKCHVNLEAYIKTHGGEIAFGWIVWQSQCVLNPEFHSAWRSPTGELIDITPKPDGEKQILFVPDPVRKWAGRVIVMPKQARIKSAAMKRFIELHTSLDYLRERYAAGEHFSEADTEKAAQLQYAIALCRAQVMAALKE